jgi:lipopolysaccharide biosynthesis glycosyltransferase
VNALVFAADEGFALPLAVAMHSTLRHLSPRLVPEIYVLDNGISHQSRHRLQRAALGAAGRKIDWIRVPSDRLIEHRGADHFTSTSYARLLIPELLPAHIRRVVYLDGDVLVTSDLSPLFDLELGDAPFAAVRDYAIASSKPYFNAGVLAIDLERWRHTGFAERALAYADAQTEPLFWADQDAMNAVAEKWHELDFRWNVQATVLKHIEDTRTDLTDRLSRERDDLYRTAAVLHFAGYHKPWIPRASPPATIRWARALKRSGWYEPGEYLRWVAPWLSKRVILGAGRRGRRVAQWVRSHSMR